MCVCICVCVCVCVCVYVCVCVCVLYYECVCVLYYAVYKVNGSISRGRLEVGGYKVLCVVYVIQYSR